jgi:hypothetical protein
MANGPSRPSNSERKRSPALFRSGCPFSWTEPNQVTRSWPQRAATRRMPCSYAVWRLLRYLWRLVRACRQLKGPALISVSHAPSFASMSPNTPSRRQRPGREAAARLTPTSRVLDDASVDRACRPRASPQNNVVHFSHDQLLCRCPKCGTCPMAATTVESADAFRF